MSVRAALAQDLGAMVGLIQSARMQLKTWLPEFWNPSANAEEMTRLWFGHLLSQPETLALVHETGAVDGFLIATKQMVPPVYDPGGPVFTIDDFHVANDAWETTGAALLDNALAELKARGVAQVIVITAQRLDGKRRLLASRGLATAAEWWTKPLA